MVIQRNKIKAECLLSLLNGTILMNDHTIRFGGEIIKLFL